MKYCGFRRVPTLAREDLQRLVGGGRHVVIGDDGSQQERKQERTDAVPTLTQPGTCQLIIVTTMTVNKYCMHIERAADTNYIFIYYLLIE